LFFLLRGKALFLLDFLEGADSDDDVAGFALFAAGDGDRCGRFSWRAIRIGCRVRLGGGARRLCWRRCFLKFWLGGGRINGKVVKQRRLFSGCLQPRDV
jgi:hypothetical protein